MTQVNDTWKNIALGIVIIGALNWLSIGLFNYDVVNALFGGTAGTGIYHASTISRVIYTIVGLAGLYALTIFADINLSRRAGNR